MRFNHNHPKMFPFRQFDNYAAILVPLNFGYPRYGTVNGVFLCAIPTQRRRRIIYFYFYFSSSFYFGFVCEMRKNVVRPPSSVRCACICVLRCCIIIIIIIDAVALRRFYMNDFERTMQCVDSLCRHFDWRKLYFYQIPSKCLRCVVVFDWPILLLSHRYTCVLYLSVVGREFPLD